ncbi:MAG: hypothetical protein M3O15_05150, partial [Acidobacteriota bacterium]|nr:hypothetical protein [Acidobacteriota bacterium]
MVSQIIIRCRPLSPFTREEHVGGDTWFFQFDTIQAALTFGSALLVECQARVMENGIYYLKPSFATILGKPALQQHRFLDDESIAAFKVADAGEPFTFSLLGNMVAAAQALPELKVTAAPRVGTLERVYLDWRAYALARPTAGSEKTVTVPTLLLDSDVIYSRSGDEALNRLRLQQETSREIFAFGGPISLADPDSRSYIRSALALVRQPDGPSMSVLSYIMNDEAELAYAWVVICCRLAAEFPGRFFFRSFQVAQGQPRPFS